jgi:hypothetical protein
MEYTIYKLVCNDLNIKYTYVGSTINFTRRKCEHKMNCNNIKKRMKVYTCINDNGGFQNWTMVMIENVVCETKLEARKRERFYYEALNATLNGVSPQTEEAERKIVRKDQQRIWHQKNVEKHPEYKEKRAEYTKNYRENNKEKLSKHRSDYRLENIEQIKIKKKEITTCSICNCEITKCHLSRHNQSQKHKQIKNDKKDNDDVKK